MRLLFLFLFLLNAGFMAWLYMYSPSPTEHITALPQSVQAIEMIVEPKKVPISQRDVSIASQQQAKQCFTIGPFNDELQAQKIMEAIKPHIKEASLRSKLELRHHRYWVLIPSQETRQAAITLSKTLAREKISDYYIVRGGERNNSISLGHFKEKSHAERRYKKLQQKGFDVVIEPIYRESKFYWLDYALTNLSDIDETAWSDLLPNGVGRLKRECK